ncbi:hypothetical protein F7725_010291 [Dissostichus mawsoni]|uniref:LRAT domain-containing protein n=1 Tax=Dissostichus mawsoni TaxID=36200 RepID=A0A7J5XNU0_DISMA|nr:hypothetical protein F7725_010291 [Dissostichus mawsoni]
MKTGPTLGLKDSTPVELEHHGCRCCKSPKNTKEWKPGQINADMAPTLYDVKPEVGDLIEIYRGTYQHWAVYVGDGFIVHLAPPSEVAGAGASKGLGEERGAVGCGGNHEWKINNSLDEEYEPRPAEVIVRDACAMVGEGLPYCVFRGNCEHFATELRYGKAESRQVRKAGQTVMVAGAAAFLGLGLVALAGAFFGGGKKENKNEK